MRDTGNTRNKRICRKVLLIGELSKQHNRKIDYYLCMPGGIKLYVFTRNYSNSCYEKCKSEIPIERLLTTRNENPAIMGLVKYVRHIKSYLIDYYDLPVYDTKGKGTRKKREWIQVQKKEKRWDDDNSTAA